MRNNKYGLPALPLCGAGRRQRGLVRAGDAAGRKGRRHPRRHPCRHPRRHPCRHPRRHPCRHPRRQFFPAALVLYLAILSAGCVTPPPGGRFPLRELPDDWEPKWQVAAAGVAYAGWQGEGFPPFHLIRVDLRTARVRTLPPYPRGKKAEKLLQEHPSALAVVNGTPFRFRRVNGEKLMEPSGLWIADSALYSQQEEEWGVLWYDKDQNRAGVTGKWATDGNKPEAEWAAGGFLPIVQDGRNVGIHGSRHARVAAGVDDGGRLLYFLLIEGERLTNQGATSREAALVLRRLGVQDAINLDGGRSATLLLRNTAGEPVVRLVTGRQQLPCFLLVLGAGGR